MRLVTLSLSSIVALLIGASIAVATVSIPIPTKKPIFVPWWLDAPAMSSCTPTRLVLAKIAEGDAELLYSASLSPLNQVSVVGQIWGTPAGDFHGDGMGGGNQWMVIAHFSSGASCEIFRGTHLPKWVTEIDGVRS